MGQLIYELCYELHKVIIRPSLEKSAPPVGAPGGPPEGRGVAGVLPLRIRECNWECN